MVFRILVLFCVAPAAWGASTHRQHLERFEALFSGLVSEADRANCPALLAPVDEKTLRAVEAALDETRAATREDHRYLQQAYRRLAVRQMERLLVLVDGDPMLLHFVFVLAAPADQWQTARAEFRRVHGYPIAVAAVGEALRRVLALRRSALWHLEREVTAAPRSARLRRLLGDERTRLPCLEWLRDRYALLAP